MVNENCSYTDLSFNLCIKS